MGRGEPPEVEPDEYERRFLASVWGEWTGGMVTEDAWLEGEYPSTEIAIVLSMKDRPGCRYLFRTQIWYPGTDSNPEAHAYNIGTGVIEWYSEAHSQEWEPGMTYEPRLGRPGAKRRRPRIG